jgi:propionyl-CoA carboxylase alpha chain
MGIQVVAVHTASEASAPFVRQADLAAAVPGYLDISALIAAAAATGADAVHPGYGFLSENPAFARAAESAGLVWVGPPAEVVEAMGDKLAAKQLMAAAGVPVLPSWSPSSSEISFPAIVKAAAGGGGKGMRLVRSRDELSDAVEAAQREALGAFGDDRVFVEPYVGAARHVEVQVLADGAGNMIHCFERECSIQRRHQKIIEEAPSPAVSSGLRQRLCQAALDAAKAIGYQGAGTVEFVLEPSGSFWFLEVNTRLQVEHPVTEAVTGLDLVREQLLIAEGHRLSVEQAELSLQGHAIEARLYAEDPGTGFLPATGVLVDWSPADEPELRWDSGVEQGSEVGVEFDPMLAKVISHAPTRSEAARRLALGLARSRVRGVTTNRDFLVACLRHPEFLAGATTTDFIERSGVALERTPSESELRVAAMAAALHAWSQARTTAPVLRTLPGSWRNSVMPPERRSYVHAGSEIEVAFRATRDGAFDFGGSIVRLLGAEAGWVSIEELGRAPATHRVHVLHDSGRVWVQGPDGDVCLVERTVDSDAEREGDVRPGMLVAPMPGRVVALQVSMGEAVRQGQVVAIVEAMKMEHRVVASRDGVVAEIAVREGDQVFGGDVLVVLSEDAVSGEAVSEEPVSEEAVSEEAVSEEAQPG